MTHKVGYYYRRDNDTLTLVWRLHEWAGRNLAAKGIREQDFRISRDMTQGEIDDYVTNRARLVFTAYDHFSDDIPAFLIDERACNVDESFIQSLIEFSRVNAPNTASTGQAASSAAQ